MKFKLTHESLTFLLNTMDKIKKNGVDVEYAILDSESGDLSLKIKDVVIGKVED